MKKTLIVASLFAAFTSTSCASHPTKGTKAHVVEASLPAIPSKLSFAGEDVPLDNFDTRESLIREMLTTTYMHSRAMLTLLATTRYFPVIEPILKKRGIPDDFKYLCMAESGLNPNIASGAGAAGLWQLMPSVAKSYGLYIDKEVDMRYNIELATEAACDHLLDSYAKFGSWTLAAAAYNLGKTGVDRRITKQGTNNYYDSFFPEETMRYVFRVLSFKLLMQDPALYGFKIEANSYYKPLVEQTTITVSGQNIDWSVVAHQNKTTYKMLRQLNQWIRDYDFANRGNMTLEVKIPSPEFRTK